MRFPQTVRDVAGDGRAEAPQCCDQQRGRRLPVHVEIAPDEDRLAAAEDLAQENGRGCQVWQGFGRCGAIALWVEEGAGGVWCGEAARDQQRRDERRDT